MRAHRLSVRRRAASIGAGAALLAPALLVLPATAASAAFDGLYFGDAVGSAMYYEEDYAGVPVSPTNTEGSLVAAAHLTAAGGGAALAGAPYFGPVVETAPGTAAGAVQSFLPSGVPNPLNGAKVPAYAEARYPATPKSADAQGPYDVSAEAGEMTAEASGHNGAPGAVPAPNDQQAASGKTSVDPAGTVTSVASASVKGVNVGPVTNIDAASTITVTQAANSAPSAVYRSHGSFTVAGQGVLFDETGFTLAGQSIPAKQGLDQINQALGQAGYKIELLPVERSVNKDNGEGFYIAGGLKISFVNGAPGQPAATLVLELARVVGGTGSKGSAASADSGGAAAPAGGASAAPPGRAATHRGGPGSAAPATAGAATLPSGNAAGASGAAVTSGGAAGALPPPVLGSGSTPVTGAGVGTPGANSPPTTPTTSLGFLRSVAPRGSDNQVLYLVFVVGGLLVAAAQQLISRFGVRLAALQRLA